MSYSYRRSTPVPGMRGGGWPTARTARAANAGYCFACAKTGDLIIKERREDGVRSYGPYHHHCLPPGRSGHMDH